MIAATGVDPASALSLVSRSSTRAVRCFTFLLRSDSTSKAIPSNVPPCGVRNESIARARRRSRAWLSCPGRYQPTMRIPRACRASTVRPSPAASTMSVFERSFAVSIHAVRTPRAASRAASAFGDA